MHGVDMGHQLPEFGTVRFAEAEIVAPSSNHSDGLPAHAQLITEASTAITHGSSRLPRGGAWAGSTRTSADSCSSVDNDMMLFTLRCTRSTRSPANSAPGR